MQEGNLCEGQMEDKIQMKIFLDLKQKSQFHTGILNKALEPKKNSASNSFYQMFVEKSKWLFLFLALF